MACKNKIHCGWSLYMFPCSKSLFLSKWAVLVQSKLQTAPHVHCLLHKTIDLIMSIPF